MDEDHQQIHVRLSLTYPEDIEPCAQRQPTVDRVNQKPEWVVNGCEMLACYCDEYLYSVLSCADG